MHPFDNPAYEIRPGDRFVLTRDETAGTKRYLVEISDRRFPTGGRDCSADDIETIWLGECDEGGTITKAFDEPYRFRVPHGAPMDGRHYVPVRDAAEREDLAA